MSDVLPGHMVCEHGPSQLHGRDCDCVAAARAARMLVPKDEYQ